MSLTHYCSVPDKSGLFSRTVKRSGAAVIFCKENFRIPCMMGEQRPLICPKPPKFYQIAMVSPNVEGIETASFHYFIYKGLGGLLHLAR
jgi:hypothetical protein